MISMILKIWSAQNKKEPDCARCSNHTKIIWFDIWFLRSDQPSTRNDLTVLDAPTGQSVLPTPQALHCRLCIHPGRKTNLSRMKKLSICSVRIKPRGKLVFNSFAVFFLLKCEPADKVKGEPSPLPPADHPNLRHRHSRREEHPNLGFLFCTIYFGADSYCYNPLLWFNVGCDDIIR